MRWVRKPAFPSLASQEKPKSQSKKKGNNCFTPSPRAESHSHLSRVGLCGPHRRQPTRLPRPWDSPGKNTGVGCHFLLQGLKVKSESEVAQSHLTLRDPMDCSLPSSSVHGIFQARVLEWGAIAFSPMVLLKMKMNIHHPERSSSATSECHSHPRCQWPISPSNSHFVLSEG